MLIVQESLCPQHSDLRRGDRNGVVDLDSYNTYVADIKTKSGWKQVKMKLRDTSREKPVIVTVVENEIESWKVARLWFHSASRTNDQ